MAGDQEDIRSLLVSEELPDKMPRMGAIAMRGNGYGDQFVVPLSRQQLAQEGPYFILKNATPGTDVVGHAAATTFDQTKPYILMYNGAAPATGKSAYLDYLKLKTTEVGTNSTDQYFNVDIESGDTYASAGTDYSTKTGVLGAAGYTNINPLVNSSSVFSIIRCGAPVADTAGATARVLAAEKLRSSIAVADDRWLFKFGGLSDGPPTSHNYLISTATIVDGVFQCAPIMVPPGWTVCIYLWAAACSVAPGFEFELAWWER